MESALSIKGQATIRKMVRDHLRLKPGDRVRFFVHPDGSVVLLPKLPTATLRGIVQTQGHRSASIEEMDKAVTAGATREFRHSKQR